MSEPSTAPPHVGSVLGDRYELVRHIARGGMGDVYEAQDRVLHRRVAVKLYRAASPADRGRFDAEVRMLAGLDHPTLVRVFDAGPHGQDAYVVLELVDGPTLAEVLVARTRLPAAEVATLGADLADALASIHARNVVHRDISTSNVLCEPDGRARLVDFGIARLLGSPRVTATLTTVGTAAFMAPEQVLGEEVTPAADVYALGLVLLELLTGRRPFPGSGQEVAIVRLARDPDVSADVPGGWRDLLGAMTARQAAERPTAHAVREQLRALATAPDEVTAAVPVAVPSVAAGVGSPLDPTVVSSTIPARSGDTQVLAVLPPLDEARRGPRGGLGGGRAVLGVVAAAVLLVLIAVALVDDGAGIERPEVPADAVGTDSSDSADTTVTTVTTSTTSTTVVDTTSLTDLLPPGIDLKPGGGKKSKAGR